MRLSKLLALCSLISLLIPLAFAAGDGEFEVTQTGVCMATYSPTAPEGYTVDDECINELGWKADIDPLTLECNCIDGCTVTCSYPDQCAEKDDTPTLSDCSSASNPPPSMIEYAKTVCNRNTINTDCEALPIDPETGCGWYQCKRSGTGEMFCDIGPVFKIKAVGTSCGYPHMECDGTHTYCTCSDNYGDCNNVEKDGCETQFGIAPHCTGCNTPPPCTSDSDCNEVGKTQECIKDDNNPCNNKCSDILDDDQDGVPNDSDLCSSTPSGNDVDENGCTKTPFGWTLLTDSTDNNDKFTIIIKNHADADNCGKHPPCVKLNADFNNILFQRIKVQRSGNYQLSASITDTGIIEIRKDSDKGIWTLTSTSPTVSNIHLQKDDTLTINLFMPARSGGPQISDAYFDNITVVELSETGETLPSHSYFDYQPTGCCPDTYCWNGTGCVDSQSYSSSSAGYLWDDSWNPENEEEGPEDSDYSEGVRCIMVDGKAEWTNAAIKPDWKNNEWGFCAELTSCFVTSDFTASGCPGEDCYVNNVNQLDTYCINNASFIDDHYCYEGGWSSRTGLLAAQLKKLALDNSENNYTLHCDVPEKTLNTPPTAVDTTYCVLEFTTVAKGRQVVVGAPLMRDQNIKTDTAANVASALEAYFLYDNDPANPELVDTNCDTAFANSENSFKQCTGPGAKIVWYNNVTQTAVYAKEGVTFGSSSFWQNFVSLIKSPFITLYDWIKSTFEKYDPVEPEDFDRIYIKTRDGRFIEGIVIHEDDTFKSATIKYNNITTDLCRPINASFKNRFKGIPLTCKYYTGKDYLNISVYIDTKHSKYTDALEGWYNMTSMVRIEKDDANWNSLQCKQHSDWQWIPNSNMFDDEAGRFCCGNDDNEYPQKDAINDVWYCCNSENKCFDENVGCVDNGAHHSSQNQVPYMCESGNWIV